MCWVRVYGYRFEVQVPEYKGKIVTGLQDCWIYRIKLNENEQYEIIITDDLNKYPDQQAISHDGNDFNIVMRIYGPKASYYKNKNSVPVGSILPLN